MRLGFFLSVDAGGELSFSLRRCCARRPCRAIGTGLRPRDRFAETRHRRRVTARHLFRSPDALCVWAFFFSISAFAGPRTHSRFAADVRESLRYALALDAQTPPPGFGVAVSANIGSGGRRVANVLADSGTCPDCAPLRACAGGADPAAWIRGCGVCHRRL
jgi:hypothetical protein